MDDFTIYVVSLRNIHNIQVEIQHKHHKMHILDDKRYILLRFRIRYLNMDRLVGRFWILDDKQYSW